MTWDHKGSGLSQKNMQVACKPCAVIRLCMNRMIMCGTKKMNSFT